MSAPPTQSVSPDQQMLDDRYGRTRRRRWPWVLGIAVVVAGVSWYGWGVVQNAVDSVDADTVGFEVNDAHSVTVHFQATVRRGAAIACAVEAQDTEHGVVGFRVVEYPASDDHTRRFDVTIPTVAEATTGLVTSCWIP